MEGTANEAALRGLADSATEDCFSVVSKLILAQDKAALYLQTARMILKSPPLLRLQSGRAVLYSK